MWSGEEDTDPSDVDPHDDDVGMDVGYYPADDDGESESGSDYPIEDDGSAEAGYDVEAWDEEHDVLVIATADYASDDAQSMNDTDANAPDDEAHESDERGGEEHGDEHVDGHGGNDDDANDSDDAAPEPWGRGGEEYGARHDTQYMYENKEGENIMGPDPHVQYISDSEMPDLDTAIPRNGRARVLYMTRQEEDDESPDPHAPHVGNNIADGTPCDLEGNHLQPSLSKGRSFDIGPADDDDDATAGDSNEAEKAEQPEGCEDCLLYTSPSPRDVEESRMPSSA